MYIKSDKNQGSKPTNDSESVCQKRANIQRAIVDKRPETTLQRRLHNAQENGLNTPQSIQEEQNEHDAKSLRATQLMGQKATSNVVYQLVEKDVKVSGSTRLVAPGTNLEDGHYTKTVNNDDPVTIERSDTRQSNRGPNFENDYDGDPKAHQYRWYRATMVKGEKDTDNSYILDDTFIYVDKAEHLRKERVEGGLQEKIIAEAKGDVFARAHGIGSAAQITAAQQSYQTWLQTHYSKAEIMDMHRSVGFEYEFATYATQTGESPGLSEHVKLGESESLSTMFNCSFLLETDTKDELEAITPPFLIADRVLHDDASINKGAANRLYQTYRNSLKALRDQAGPQARLNSLDYTKAGLGKSWSFTGAMAPLYTGARNKHSNSPDNIYSQMNLSLTADEIAEFTETRSETASINYKAVRNANRLVQNLFASQKDAVIAQLSLEESKALSTALQVDNAVINISKGLAGLVTIPSILAHNAEIDQTTTIFSSVKEYCGLWLKDSIPNLVDNTLTTSESRLAMSGLIKTVQSAALSGLDGLVDEQLETIKKGMRKSITYGFKKDTRAATKLQAYKTTFRQEYATTIDLILKRLANDAPSRDDIESAPEYGKEVFGKAGLGVRKDTMVNIQSGKKRSLHLAEFRNDYVSNKFLGGKRRQRDSDSESGESETIQE